eukprot:12523-Heterococcus_DN1.PRE.2
MNHNAAADTRVLCTTTTRSVVAGSSSGSNSIGSYSNGLSAVAVASVNISICSSIIVAEAVLTSIKSIVWSTNASASNMIPTDHDKQLLQGVCQHSTYCKALHRVQTRHTTGYAYTITYTINVAPHP